VLFFLSNLHITPDVRRDLGYAASATGSLYRSPVCTENVIATNPELAKPCGCAGIVETADS
jgi:hypothetical protein